MFMEGSPSAVVGFQGALHVNTKYNLSRWVSLFTVAGLHPKPGDTYPSDSCVLAEALKFDFSSN